MGWSSFARARPSGTTAWPGFWRVEQAATGAPLVYTYILDPATGRYRDSEIFTGVVEVAVPFQVKVDLSRV